MQIKALHTPDTSHNCGRLSVNEVKEGSTKYPVGPMHTATAAHHFNAYLY